MKRKYGIILPSSLYERMDEFVKGKPKWAVALIGWCIGLPLVLADFLIFLGGPVWVFLLFLFLPGALGISGMPAWMWFGGMQLAFFALNRYASQSDKRVAAMWAGYYFVLNIILVFLQNNNVLPGLWGLAFIGLSFVNAASNVSLSRNANRRVGLVRAASEVAIIAMLLLLPLIK